MTKNQISELNTRMENSELSISQIDDLVERISGMYSSQQFADVVFIVEEERIPAHRLILAARSEYFRAMLFGGLSEAHKKEIQLSNISLTHFKTLLKYLYTGELKISLGSDKIENLLELLDLANLYGLAKLVQALSEHLCAQICTDNVDIILNTACLYNLENLKEKCLSYFDSNALVMIKHDCIKLLSMETFIEVIKRDTFLVPEEEIFKTILCWKQENPEIVDIRPLISCVRFPLMKISMLVTDVRDSGLIEDAELLEIIKEKELPKRPLERVKFGITCIEGNRTETNMFEGQELIFKLTNEAKICTINISGNLRSSDYKMTVFDMDWEACGHSAEIHGTFASVIHIFPKRIVKLIRLRSTNDCNICIWKPRVSDF